MFERKRKFSELEIEEQEGGNSSSEVEEETSSIESEITETEDKNELNDENEEEEEEDDDENRCCKNCGATSTPMWRRGINNKLLCNKCGLFYRRHNIDRPLVDSLVKFPIKSSSNNSSTTNSNSSNNSINRVTVPNERYQFETKTLLPVIIPLEISRIRRELQQKKRVKVEHPVASRSSSKITNFNTDNTKNHFIEDPKLLQILTQLFASQ